MHSNLILPPLPSPQPLCPSAPPFASIIPFIPILIFRYIIWIEPPEEPPQYLYYELLSS